MSLVSSESLLPHQHSFHDLHNSLDLDGVDDTNPLSSLIPLELEAGPGDRVPPSKFQAAVNFFLRCGRARRGGNRDSGPARQRRGERWKRTKDVVDVGAKVVAMVVGVLTAIKLAFGGFHSWRKYKFFSA